MNLFRAYIFLSWGGIFDHSVESQTNILFSAYPTSLTPPCSGGLSMIL